ncbi:MAG: metallophosphoesterase [Anaerolineae bacterium]|nr:metallophosphoesterase [Anaerolineae bacterium]
MMLYVIGDIHGHYNMVPALLQAQNLIDEDLKWAGGDAVLWFMGDFFDRGPDGVSAVELFMRLQQEAAAVGGRVDALIGNHDVLLLSVARFGQFNETILEAASTEATVEPGDMDEFTAGWISNGGVPMDLARLTPEQAEWLANLPALALEGDNLLVHADSTLYLHYGSTIEAVNEAFRNLLHSDDREAWGLLLDQFSEHEAFWRDAAKAHRFTQVFGGRQIIHGHTPIMKITGALPGTVTEPLLYAGGRCVDVDPGLYRGGPGFVYQLK